MSIAIWGRAVWQHLALTNVLRTACARSKVRGKLTVVK